MYELLVGLPDVPAHGIDDLPIRRLICPCAGSDVHDRLGLTEGPCDQFSQTRTWTLRGNDPR
jgi:hypothetical protein